MPPAVLVGRDPDADCLRRAVLILRARARRETFAFRVIVRVLERTAGKIEAEKNE